MLGSGGSTFSSEEKREMQNPKFVVSRKREHHEYCVYYANCRLESESVWIHTDRNNFYCEFPVRHNVITVRKSSGSMDLKKTYGLSSMTRKGLIR